MYDMSDAYFSGVKARRAGISKAENPHDPAKLSLIDAIYADKQREEWDRGWDAENEYLATGYQRDPYRK